MIRQLIVLLLIGIAAPLYALDLSHAAQPTHELDPRVLNFLSDLYGQVIYPPLNHVVTNIALLGAQLLAGVAQNGIPAPNGRTFHPTEAELRGFWSGLWNEAIKPPIENALTGVSLLAAQLLAGIAENGVNLGIGKRDLTEAEMRGFLDDLSNAMNSVFANVIQKPLEDALSGGALMLAQVLAGLGTNGINLSNVLGKRDLTEAEMRGFLDDLSNAMNSVFANVIQKPLEDALSGGALMLAQVLAGLGTNGINLSNVLGKRDASNVAEYEALLRGVFGTVSGAVVNGLAAVWNNIFQVPLENFVQNSALVGAQFLGNLGVSGVNLGKRSIVADRRNVQQLDQLGAGTIPDEWRPILENVFHNNYIDSIGALASLLLNNSIGR